MDNIIVATGKRPILMMTTDCCGLDLAPIPQNSEIAVFANEWNCCRSQANFCISYCRLKDRKCRQVAMANLPVDYNSLFSPLWTKSELRACTSPCLFRWGLLFRHQTLYRSCSRSQDIPQVLQNALHSVTFYRDLYNRWPCFQWEFSVNFRGVCLGSPRLYYHLSVLRSAF